MYPFAECSLNVNLAPRELDIQKQPFSSRSPLDQQLLQRANLPPAVREQHDLAEPPPPLNELNSLRFGRTRIHAHNNSIRILYKHTI